MTSLQSTPEVTVVIPHYADIARLDRCLAAVVSQECSFSFEVVVADNNSPCGQDAVAVAIANRAHLVLATKPGAGPARNAGVQAARGRYLAFTDSDCIPEPGWLAAGIAALTKHDFVGGAMTVLVGNHKRLSGAEAFERIFAFNNRRYVEKEGFTVTANLFCSKELFERVGGFRSDLSEDLEWCQRARASGFQIGYAENAVVGHPARANWSELLHKWRRLNAEMFAVYKLKPNGRMKWALRSLLLPGSILVDIPKVLKSRSITGAYSRIMAISTLTRLRLWRMINCWNLLLKGRN